MGDVPSQTFKQLSTITSFLNIWFNSHAEHRLFIHECTPSNVKRQRLFLQEKLGHTSWESQTCLCAVWYRCLSCKKWIVMPKILVHHIVNILSWEQLMRFHWNPSCPALRQEISVLAPSIVLETQYCKSRQWELLLTKIYWIAMLHIIRQVLVSTISC